MSALMPRTPLRRRPLTPTHHRHAPWCGQHCRAQDAALGEHRSDPITVVAGPAGGASVIGTRTAQVADGRQHLELRISIPLTATDEAGRAAVAERAMRAITTAVLHATTRHR